MSFYRRGLWPRPVICNAASLDVKDNYGMTPVRAAKDFREGLQSSTVFTMETVAGTMKCLKNEI